MGATGQPAASPGLESGAPGRRFCFFGASLDVDNMGCRALAASLVRLAFSACPDARVFLLYGNRQAGTRRVKISADRVVEAQVVNYRMSPRARLHEHLFCILLLGVIWRIFPAPWARRRILAANTWLRTVAQADFVGDIFAGDSFSDIYGIRRLLYSLAPLFTAWLLKKPFVLLPQTYGPYKSRLARRLARFFVLRARRVYARDAQGAAVLRQLLGAKADRVTVGFAPDVAFCLEPDEPERLEIEPALPDGGGTLIGLNVSGLLYMGGYTQSNMFGLRCDYAQWSRQMLRRLLTLPGTRVLLTPHTFETGPQSDLRACRDLWDGLSDGERQRAHLVTGRYDQSQMKAIIGRCDFFIGSRMHACIAALSQGIPAVGVAYSRKFAGVFETAQVGDMVVDARTQTAEEITAACLERFEARATIAERLRRVIPQVRAQALGAIQNEVLGGR